MALSNPDCAPAADRGTHALDPYYQFLTLSPPVRPAQTSRSFGRVGAALVAHIALFAVVALVKSRPAAVSTPEAAPAKMMPLVWAPTIGGGGSEGGGGEESSKKPTPAQLVGADALTVPATPPPQLEPVTIVETPTPRFDIPVVPVAQGLQEGVGTIAEVSLVDDPSRGPGGGLGVGGKTGDGIGDRGGDRIGDGGNRGGPGQGDEFTPGNGVSWPRLVQEVKPNYTADAMRAQVQGYVELEITVLADGSVGRVHIVRSLDPRFGLDEEAIKAVRRWRFDPGRKLGRAVATRVGVELAFHLR